MFELSLIRQTQQNQIQGRMIDYKLKEKGKKYLRVNIHQKSKTKGMFGKQAIKQPSGIQRQKPLQQRMFQQQMMIGQIHLECNQVVNNNDQVVNNKPVQEVKFIPKPQYLCSECKFEKTVQLSQHILQLREKVSWFERQTKDLDELGRADETKSKEIIKVLQNAIDKEIVSDEQAERQLKHLQKQLASVQQQLHQQQLLSQQYKDSLQHFIQQRTQFQQKLYSDQFQFHRLTRQYHSQILQKYHTLQQTVKTFETTNFVSIFYTFTFESNRSYLNGQRITHQNIWKIVQIVLFYQTKYDVHYHPLYHVFWPQMKLQKDPQTQPQQTNSGNLLDSINLGNLLKKDNLLESINLGSLLRKQSAKQVDIDCESQQSVLNNWMPCLLLQVRQLFHFINREAKKQEKIRYEIGRDGEFEALKGKTFKNLKDKFAIVVKYLMMDIEQINKIEFFARQNRLNSD